MTKKLVYVGVVVLALIAVILGYKIYQQTISSQSAPKPKPSAEFQDVTIPKPGVNNSQQTDTSSQSIDLDSIFKRFPGPNATAEEIQSFHDYLYTISRETGLITLKDCKADPQVLRVKKGQEFKIKNEDSVDHKLTMPGKQVSVKAAGEITLTASEIGEYGYGCDTAPNKSNVGIIQTV